MEMNTVAPSRQHAETVTDRNGNVDRAVITQEVEKSEIGTMVRLTEANQRAKCVDFQIQAVPETDAVATQTTTSVRREWRF